MKTHSRRAALCALLTATLITLTACQTVGTHTPNSPGLAFPNPSSTTYEQAAEAYNRNARQLQRLWANAVVRISYTDENDERRQEQGDGRLQIIQPDRVALNIGKLGQTYLWTGCDATRYWWIDLTSDEHFAFAGKHQGYQRSRARSFGIVVPPLEIITLLGIKPIPPTGGAIQVSSDGNLLGLTTKIADGQGRQRIWLDTNTALPVQIEILGSDPQSQLVAELEDHQTVAVRGTGNPPQLATRIKIAHTASGSLVTLDLSEMEDGIDRLRPEAFNLGTLLTQMRVDKLYDLDKPRTPTHTPAKTQE